MVIIVGAMGLLGPISSMVGLCRIIIVLILIIKIKIKELDQHTQKQFQIKML